MNRKKILISVFVAMLAAGSAQAQRVKGSDTLLPLTQELAEDYLEEHPDGEVIVTGGGSGVGIAALMENTTDIAMASRRIKFPILSLSLPASSSRAFSGARLPTGRRLAERIVR